MSTHAEDSDHIGEFEDAADDGHLVIRIPNPKVYMARQSRWVGRRGKPRCDHCRLSNLKCDRVLPICNHCSWANYKECKYTPLPTPAHRGIPRCDRCRIYNMKCDRNLPICNNCTEGAPGTVCNYTPKKKQKGREDNPEQPRPQPAAEGPSRKISGHGQPAVHEQAMMKSDQDVLSKHTFYGQNIASTFGHTSLSPTHSETESASDHEYSQTGRFTADFAIPQHRMSASAYPTHSDIPSRSTDADLEIIPSHTFPKPHHKILLHSTHIEPWRHPSFIPLPDFVYQYLYQVDTVEVPKRSEFERSVNDFIDPLMDPIRETALFDEVKYKKVCRALLSGDTSQLSEHMRFWLSLHRICSGSEKYNVLLVPRDSVFEMDEETAYANRRYFVTDLLNRNADVDSLQVHHYDRIPVFHQIYDILTYAHRGHAPVPQMLLEIVRLRFVRHPVFHFPSEPILTESHPAALVLHADVNHLAHDGDLCKNVPALHLAPEVGTQS